MLHELFITFANTKTFLHQKLDDTTHHKYTEHHLLQ